MTSSLHSTRPTIHRPQIGALLSSLAVAWMTTSCSSAPSSQDPVGPVIPPVETGIAAVEKSSVSSGPSARQRALAALTPTQAQPPSDVQKQLSSAIDQYFQRAATRRYYVHLDKPIYQPGETIWFRIWELATPTLAKGPSHHAITAQLISPKGANVLQKRIRVQAGVATNDLTLPEGVQGGEYKLRVTSALGGSVERKLIVSSYQPPRIKKKLEFLRKAYGPGDSVRAAMRLHRATGEPLAQTTAIAIVSVDQIEVGRMPVKTNAEGKGVVRFALPGQIARGDGLLTLLVEDGGVVESVQKRIPIVLKEMNVQLFPEGGDLVEGLPGRVYFMAKNLLGKPADIEGRVVDDTGAQVAAFRSLHNGMGRFEITPTAARSYFVEIAKPVGITQKIPLPAAKPSGCSMTAIDDVDSKRNDIRVALWCSQAQTVITTAVLLEKRLGDVSVDVTPGQPSVVSLPAPVGSQGAVRVTAMDDELNPLAERLMYRGRSADLSVEIEADRVGYAPRDAVELRIRTKDLAGKPVRADLSLAVVDDTVLSFADDKTAHMLTRLYLESEMPGQEIEEPNFYFSNDPKAAAALDLVLGTQGFRRFEWRQVFAPPATIADTTTKALDGAVVREDRVLIVAQKIEIKDKEAEKRPPREAAKLKKVKAASKKKPAKRARGKARGRRARRNIGPMEKQIMRDPHPPMAGADKNVDDDWAAAGELGVAHNQWAWAPVRVFPAPNYRDRYDGPRIDFRETIHWQPSVQTDETGTATVRFFLSDAITSFRAIAEGVSVGGLPGRGEVLVTSKLPVSLAVKMPLEVSAGDRVKLPITLTNETTRAYNVSVSTQFGAAFRVHGGIPASVSLRGGERTSFVATLDVIGQGQNPDDGKALVAIDTSNLRDEVSRTINVVPLGFPQEISLSGTLTDTARHKLALTGALPGTVQATINLYPSPLATMVKGTEAIIREPSGCFEQASSANYPNIMVLDYLNQHDEADPDLIERTMGMLDRGYKKLTGYESPKHGYEWFGGNPGHEALTAYGLMEFADMTRVYDDVDRTMIARTAAWLKSRRDGKGGFERNKRALDSFGQASVEVTNGYIAYALSEAGENDLKQEVAYQREQAKRTKDPYLLALATNVLLNTLPQSTDTASALAKLQGMQTEDGSFPGADHSITRSGGVALTIETTALATLAMIKAGKANTPAARHAVNWLNGKRSGYGRFGSTQSTILALKAMISYAESTRATESGGSIALIVNGKQVGELTFEKGHKDALVFDDLASSLTTGNNVIELRMNSSVSLPYSIAIDYRSKMPATSPDTSVAVSTSLSKSTVPVGEGVRMNVTVKNVTDKGLPMTLARVGLPGGLVFQTWQLKELKDKGIIDFYETRAREVVLYFRSMDKNAVMDIPLDLLARVPGTYVAPASRAYLYYTDEFKHWAEPTRITIN